MLTTTLCNCFGLFFWFLWKIKWHVEKLVNKISDCLSRLWDALRKEKNSSIFFCLSLFVFVWKSNWCECVIDSLQWQWTRHFPPCFVSATLQTLPDRWVKETHVRASIDGWIGVSLVRDGHKSRKDGPVNESNQKEEEEEDASFFFLRSSKETNERFRLHVTSSSSSKRAWRAESFNLLQLISKHRLSVWLCPTRVQKKYRIK